MIFVLTLIQLALSDICSEVPFLWNPTSLPLKTDAEVERVRKCQDRLDVFSSRVKIPDWKAAFSTLVAELNKLKVDERRLGVDLSGVAVAENDERILMNFGPAFEAAHYLAEDSFARVLSNPTKEEISKILEIAHLMTQSILRVCASGVPLAERWLRVCPSCSVNAAYNHLSAGELYFLSRHKIRVSLKIARTTGEPLRDGSMTNFPVELAPLRAFLCMRFQVECAEMYALVAPIRAAASVQLNLLRSHFKRPIFKERFLAMADPTESTTLGLDWEWTDLVGEVDLRLLEMFATADTWPMFMRMLRQIITRSERPMLEGQAVRADVDMIIKELLISKNYATQLFVQKVWNLCRAPEYSETPNCVNLHIRLETADLMSGEVPIFGGMDHFTDIYVTEKALSFVTAAMPERAPAELILDANIRRFIDSNTLPFNTADPEEVCAACMEKFSEQLHPCVICQVGDTRHSMCPSCAERHFRHSLAHSHTVPCPICRRPVFEN